MSGTRKRGGRFDALEVVLISGFVGGVALICGIATSEVIRPGLDGQASLLRATYGPHRNSENFEEWIIRDFFQDRRGGFFVDVGASDFRRFSNTYFLETSLGWEGIAVEPLRQFEADYVAHRPRTRFRPFFVSNQSNTLAKLFVNERHTEVSSSDKTFTERWENQLKELEVPTITLDDLLQAERVDKIDFLSMDIELHEPQALAGFTIRRFAPQLVCIEAHPEVRQAILQYFADNGYIVLGKYLRSDVNNLYFIPHVSGAR